MSNYRGFKTSPILAELYDLVPMYAVKPDVDFYVQYCSATGGKILELGCGTGRVLIPAARSGCEITGLDISEHVLTRCRDKLQLEAHDVQERVRLVQGNMIDFDIKDHFDLVIIPFRPFQQLISVDDQLACLHRIHRHLNPSGKLVFDFFQVNMAIISDPNRKEEVEDVAEFTLPDGRRLRRTHRLTALHRAEQYNDVELIYYLTDKSGNTERIVEPFPFRYFFRYEVEHLLARCGFEVRELFGDFDKTPLSDDSPEIVFVAEKI